MMTEPVSKLPRKGHHCEVMYTRNDELMYLMCECSEKPVFTFRYPPSPVVHTDRPSLDAIDLAVADHYKKLDVN